MAKEWFLMFKHDENINASVGAGFTWASISHQSTRDGGRFPPFLNRSKYGGSELSLMNQSCTKQQVWAVPHRYGFCTQGISTHSTEATSSAALSHPSEGKKEKSTSKKKKKLPQKIWKASIRHLHLSDFTQSSRGLGSPLNKLTIHVAC